MEEEIFEFVVRTAKGELVSAVGKGENERSFLDRIERAEGVPGVVVGVVRHREHGWDSEGRPL